jgi:hypothetical protein
MTVLVISVASLNGVGTYDDASRTAWCIFIMYCMSAEDVYEIIKVLQVRSAKVLCVL